MYQLVPIIVRSLSTLVPYFVNNAKEGHPWKTFKNTVKQIRVFILVYDI